MFENIVRLHGRLWSTLLYEIVYSKYYIVDGSYRIYLLTIVSLFDLFRAF